MEYLRSNAFLVTFSLILVQEEIQSSVGVSPADVCARDDYFCPAGCECEIRVDGIEVSCSGQYQAVELGLPKELPKRTTTFYTYIFYTVNVLSSYSFSGCSEITYLQMNNCDMKEIGENAFQGLDNLRILCLVNNDLNLTNVSSTAFDGMPELREIYLQQFPGSLGGSVEYNARIFTNLPELTTLVLDYLPTIKFGIEFSQLAHLTCLKVQSYVPSTITNTTFEVFNESAIEELVLSSHLNFIDLFYDLEPMAFAHFRHMRILDLSDNDQLGFVNASKSWFGLRFTNISVLNLTHITGKETRLTSDIFRDLSFTKLAELILNGNQIYSIDFQLSNYLPYLKRLSIDDNQLVATFYFDFAASFASHQHIVSLRASDQVARYTAVKLSEIQDISKEQSNISANIESTPIIMPTVPTLKELYLSNSLTDYLGDHIVPEIHIKGESSMTHLDFSKNEIKYLLGPFRFIHAPSDYVTVDLSNSDISSIYNFFDNSSAFWIEGLLLANNNLGSELHNPVDIFHNMANLKRLDLSNNHCTIFTSFYQTSLRGLRSLTLSQNRLRVFYGKQFVSLVELDLSQNEFENIPLSDFTHMGNLESLDLSQNAITTLDLDYLKNLTRLKFLDFKQNLIREIVSDFHYFPDLISLDLSSNRLKILADSIFGQLDNLQNFNLSQNSLGSISFMFDHMKNLDKFDLSGNVLSQLNTMATVALDKIGGATVALSDNDLLCSCSTLDFAVWLQKSTAKVHNWWQLNCTFHERSQCLQLLNDLIVPTLRIECDKQIWLQVSAAVLISTLILLAISVILYRYRWEVRISLHRFAWNRSWLSHPNSRHRYDAFVMHSESDSGWVTKELMVHIEGEEHNLRLLIPDRNFLGGPSHEDNLLSAVHESRRILLIVTESLLRNNWTAEEINIAKMKTVQEGRHPFVIVFLERVPPELIPKTLQRIIKRNVYLDWPGTTEEQEEFWTQLAAHLRVEGCPDIDHNICSTCRKPLELPP